MLSPLMTQIVGSYAKPNWLARHQRFGSFDGSWWRPEPSVLQEAKEDAVRLSIYEQERAGLELVSDGEAQRQAYDRDFLRGLTGIDFSSLDRVEFVSEVQNSERRTDGLEEFHSTNRLNPRVVGDITWTGARKTEELKFLKKIARKPIKANIVGPISLVVRVSDTYYRDEHALVMALADTLNKELLALDAEGVDVLQVDEPMFHMRLSLARKYGKEAIARTVRGVKAPVLLHACYGYAISTLRKRISPTYIETIEIMADCPVAGISLEYEQPGHGPDILRYCRDKHVAIGLIDLGKLDAETPGHVAGRIRAALDVVPPEKLHPSSDCGMWFVPRDVAYAKISALAEGTEIIRRELRSPAKA
jgi:5-methyltetrahydropteroyltriglutamate--homocysteine methyltransferase